jgi:predicted nucleic acid-binding protein
VDWALRNQHRWYIPVVAAMEIEQGVRKLHRLGSTRRAAELATWLAETLAAYRSRIVEIDLVASLRAGAITDRLIAAGRFPGLSDVLIAAIADTRGLGVLTRNHRHFELMGVPVFDPFSTDTSRRPS